MKPMNKAVGEFPQLNRSGANFPALNIHRQAGILPFDGKPTLMNLQQYNTMVAGSVELTRSVLYDTVAYAQAGQTSLTFFQLPVGQSSKTYQDTNMTAAGQLPQPQSFLIQTMELYFYPASTVLPANAGLSTTVGVSNFVNDTYKVFKYGSYLNLFIGSKNYVTDAPLQKFPPRNGLSGFAGIADTTVSSANSVAYASNGGPVYEINPPILLTPNVNFNVSLNWNTAQAISAAGTIMCSMSGWLLRLSQ